MTHPATTQKLVVLLQITFLIFLSLFYISRGIFPSLEMIIATSIAILLWQKQHRKLLVGLLPFFILLLTFHSLRSFADNLTPFDIHVAELINCEKFLFSGVIPSNYLQSMIGSSEYRYWIEIPSSIFYMSHFVVPIIISIILWNFKREYFGLFLIGLLLLTYAGFITYVLYPAAPPWWATKHGYLDDQPVYLMALAYPTIVEFAGPNPVAAIPSLHMAWPTYILFFCLYTWGKKLIGLLLLPLGVGFSAVYLGHHYVIDLIIGVIYGILFFGVTILIQNLRFMRGIKS